MKRILVPFALICCVLLTSCGSIPKLSSDETEMVTEYAASLLLKYDSANHSRLVDTSQFLDKYYAAVKNYEDGKKAYYDALEREEEQRRREAEAQERANEAYNNDGTGGATVVETTGQTKTQASNIPIAEFLGLGDFTIDYSDYALLDSYPEDTEDLYFSLSATKGKKLLVLYFNTVNNASSVKTLDIFNMKAAFRISVNGGNYTRVFETMLGDVLSEYLGDFDAGESKRLALVLEVPEDISIQTLSMTIKTDGGTLTKNLQ